MDATIGRVKADGTAGTIPASAPGAARADSEDAKLREACQELESVFLQVLIEEMRKTVPRDEFFGGGRGEEVFQGVFDQEVARKMAARGGIGLADVLYTQLQLSGRASHVSGGQGPPESRGASPA